MSGYVEIAPNSDGSLRPKQNDVPFRWSRTHRKETQQHEDARIRTPSRSRWAP
jgi:hypothetical protein